MLHGMCDAPQNECGYFHQGAKEAGYLVCPRADIGCGGNAFQWTAAPKVLDPLLASSIEAVKSAVDLDEKGDNVLVGFSQGAFRGVDAATRSGVHFSGLVLIAAAITPDVARLKAAGVRRVWLTAGDFDGSKNAMLKATRLLVAGGIEAKFVSLGQVGHTFPSDMPDRMEAAISWVRASAPEVAPAP
jgi:predicted esterase